MEDVRDLKESQLDAMREVANIGAGHAATALSQMTNRTIMITVPRVNIRPLEEACDTVGAPDEVTAAILMHMMGDLTGRALLLFPQPTAAASTPRAPETAAPVARLLASQWFGKPKQFVAGTSKTF